MKSRVAHAATAAFALCLGAPALAEACETHTDDVRQSGAALNEARAQLQLAEDDFNTKNAEYEEFRNAPMQWGTSRWVDEELRRLAYELDVLVMDWTARERDARAADVRLGEAVDAHEAACGAEAQTADLLAQLGLFQLP